MCYARPVGRWLALLLPGFAGSVWTQSQGSTSTLESLSTLSVASLSKLSFISVLVSFRLP